LTDKLLSAITPADRQAACLAVEEALVQFRDARISTPLRGHGMVIRERDGRDSAAIRLSTDDVLQIALRAIQEQP
jgi:hypothetical protein